MKLKKRDRKLVTNLWKALKNIDSTIVKTITDQLGGKVTEVTEENLVEFKLKLSEKDLETFNGHDKVTQNKIVAKSKEDSEFMRALIDLVDIIVSEYDSLETEIDAIVSSATGKTLEELDDMDLDDFIKLMVQVVKANLNFSSMLK